MTEQSSSAPVARFTIAGDDVEYARQTYQDAYGGTHFSVAAPDRGFSFRYASIGDERVSLRTSTLDGSLRGEVPHLREYVVSWFRSGTGEVHRGRSSYAGGASLPFLLPSEQRFEFAFSPHRQNLIHFAPDFLEDVASELHAGRPQAVAFDHGATPAPDAVARWRAAVSSATTVLLDAAAAPLVRLNAQRPLALALLQLFPWFGLDLPPDLRRPSSARLRTALEYLQHHAHEAITPADAARAAGMHTRTLQQATRSHLGVSPSEYLRGVRLDRARHDLTEGMPGSQTVAAIAHDWGFGHLGRFSAFYRGRFGERPGDTLRR